MNLESLVPDLLAHATAEQPRECCGLAIVSKGKLRYWPCKNLSADGGQFEIDPEDYVRAETAGEVVGVCHSHVYQPPTPSEADLVMCENTAVPWLIVNYPTGSSLQIEPSGYVAPLVGRQYAHGVLDCYQIIVDHYDRELGITLPHFRREDNWWLEGGNLYLENFEKAGFECVGDGNHQDIRVNDVLLMQVGSPVPNHAAIYLGEETILQHICGRLSSRDVYGGYWHKSTTHVLRHKGST